MASPYESLDDLQLVARFQAGDQSAFDELHRRHGRRLVAFLKPKCLGHLDPFDVSQEVWLRVHKALPEFQHNSFRGWLFQIARNLVIDMYRKVQLKADSLDVGIDPAAPSPKLANPHMDAMLDCLGSLKSQYVDAVKDTLSGFTTEEIAQKHGIGTDNVDKWRYRGRNLIKDCVEQKLS